MQEYLDETWYNRLRADIARIEDTNWLQGFMKISDKERVRFLEDQVENPRFTYNKEGAGVLWKGPFEKMMTEVMRHEKDAVVEELYLKKITNQFHRIDMLAATINENDEAFTMASQELYGKPKRKYFAYVAKRVIELCDRRIKKHPKIAKRLRKHFSKIDVNGIDISADILPPTVEGQPIEHIEEVMTVFSDVINGHELEGWEIRVDSEGKRQIFSVNSFSKIVNVPKLSVLKKRLKTPTDVSIRAVAEHEIGVHARRVDEAMKQPLMLLRIGLHAYLKGEEGVASYVQQQVEGADEFYGFDRYLAASLALGLDGNPKDFRAVYSIMKDFYRLQLEDKVYPDRLAQRAAWNVCVRVFRGTTGQSVGTIYTKDIVYLEGNIGIWHLLSEKPSAFDTFFVGKYNPLSKMHVRALETLGVIGK